MIQVDTPAPVPTQDGLMQLTDSVITTFHVAKNFSGNTERINSIDFSPSGDTLITSSDDDSMIIYDCEKGTNKKTLNSKKYGVDLIRYTHQNTAIHGSNKLDDTIRHLSLHDNKYIRYFQGHQQKVISLCMSPVDDTFLSGSLDKTLRLWDLRSPNCQGLMNLAGRPVANFDPEGMIFGVGLNNDTIKLYDLKSFDKGPFCSFKSLPHQEPNCDWRGLKFSPNGKSILISTAGNKIYLIDSFNGELKFTLEGHKNNGTAGFIEASFSPDSNYVISGSMDGKIHVWSTSNGREICVFKGDHEGKPITSVQFNPKLMMMASASTTINFLIPLPEDLTS